MVYIYGLVIAGYLVLGFISRGDGMPGFYKMAAFICQKAGRTGIGKNAGRIPNESIVRRDLAILYPFGQTKREEERFYTERIRIVLMILLAGDILAIASYAAAGRSLLMTEQGELIRDQVGGEDRAVQRKNLSIRRITGWKCARGNTAGSRRSKWRRNSLKSFRI